MKKLVIASAIFAAAGSASAQSWFEDCKPVVGVDFKWTKVKNSGTWPKVFPENLPGASVYVGTKFMENFGAELGYDSTTKRNRQRTSATNDRIGGAVVPGPIVTRASVRFSGPHLDLVGFWPMENCVELFASLGIGWVKPKVTVNRLAGASSNFATDLTSISGDSKSIARIGVGANWMATDVIGLRVKALWEDTSRLKVKSNAAAANQVLTNFKPFKDSFSVAVGAFLKF
ncbi:MAG: OmpA-like transrane domain [Pseudomonadota bacterium]|jgi:hypothetical protein